MRLVNQEVYGPPPENTVWTIDFQEPGSDVIHRSVTVPDERAEVVTALMLGFTRVRRRDDLLRRPYVVTPQLADLLRMVLADDDVPPPNGGFIAVFQR